MIAAIQEAYPDLSIRRLCALVGTGRTLVLHTPVAR